jgi:Tfp pilus assembly protein PilX
MKRNQTSHRRRGFLELDILAGLVIVGALTLALAAVLGRQHRAVQKLADTRAATQLAESVLTELQAGRAQPKPGGEADVSVEVRPAGDWVEVDVTVRGARATLVGPAPQAPAGGAAGGAR